VLALRDGQALVRRRLVGVLFALAAVPSALAAGVAVDHREGLVGGTVGFVVAAAGLALLPTVPGVLMTATMSLITTFAAVDVAREDSPLVRAVAIIVLGWPGR